MNELNHDFELNGFSIIKGLLSNTEVESILSQVDSVFSQALMKLGVKTEQYSLDEKYLLLKNEYPKIKAHCYDLLGRLDAVVHIMSSNRITQFCKEIYRTPMVIDGTQIRIDDKSNDRVLPLHQETNQMAFYNITCWVPLVDVNEDIGGMMVVPGSHKDGFKKQVYYPEFNNYHGLPENLVEEGQCVQFKLNKGDAVLFHPCLYHGSVKNKSDKIRWTMISRYNELNSLEYLYNPNAAERIPVEAYGLEKETV